MSSSSSSHLPAALFRCSVCLDLFTEPVSLPCGHTFCLCCVRAQWAASGSSHCSRCSTVFQEAPQLRENAFAREMSEQLRKQTGPRVTAPHHQRFCRIHGEDHHTHRPGPLETQWAERKVSPRRVQGRAGGELAYGLEVFGVLMRRLEESRAELPRRIQERQHLLASEDHLHLLQTLDGPEQALQGEVSVGAGQGLDVLRESLTDSLDFLQTQIHAVTERELKVLSQYAVDLTLDPETANPWLKISGDGKQVSDGNVERDVSNSADRFDTAPCVLSREAISKGRSYWEVGVSGKNAWDVGVARQSVRRQGLVTMSPQDGYWSICLRGGDEYRACDHESVLLPLVTRPHRVGIYVDMEQGRVSFYDSGAGAHMFSFTGQRFAGNLLAYFNPDTNDAGDNEAPLVILPLDTVTI